MSAKDELKKMVLTLRANELQNEIEALTTELENKALEYSNILKQLGHKEGPVPELSDNSAIWDRMMQARIDSKE
jgi:hypothetical protein